MKEWRDARGHPGLSWTGRTIWSVLMLGGAIAEKAAVSPKKQNTKADLESKVLQLECDRRELELTRSKGELVLRAVVKAACAELFHRVRSRLLAVP